jgi:cytochrome c556
MTRLFNVSLIAFAIGASTIVALQEKEADGPKPQEKDRVIVPHEDNKSKARRSFMQTKLKFSQDIFEGLTIGDFEKIKAAIKNVQGITESQNWVAVDNDFYRKLTADFETTTDRLSEAAESGNIEAVALRYYQMSTSCIDCHQHMREAEYEF